MRRTAIPFVLALAAAALTAPAAAQQEVYVVPSSPAWLGVSYDLQWVQTGDQCTPRVVVDAVVHGSPAERAGLRPGDAITALDGEPVPPGRLKAIAARLSPGDSVELQLVRQGRTRTVTAVADQRPARPLSIFVEPTRIRTRSVPVIEQTGEALVATNLAAEWDPGRVRSYWIRTGDGRTEYRTLGGWSSDELDRRVARLLACADSLGGRPAAWSDGATVSTGLQQVQARADSLRALMNRRAMQRGAARTVVRTGTPDSVHGPSVMHVELGPDGSYAFQVEEHLAVGLRGVAGAELTALEPELADYFRNADRGLLVLRIAPGTPADRAGLRPGDVVIAADGRRLESVGELRQIIALPQAGDVELRVVRRGRTRDLTLRRD